MALRGCAAPTSASSATSTSTASRSSAAPNRSTGRCFPASTQRRTTPGRTSTSIEGGPASAHNSSSSSAPSVERRSGTTSSAPVPAPAPPTMTLSMPSPSRSPTVSRSSPRPPHAGSPTRRRPVRRRLPASPRDTSSPRPSEPRSPTLMPRHRRRWSPSPLKQLVHVPARRLQRRVAREQLCLGALEPASRHCAVAPASSRPARTLSASASRNRSQWSRAGSAPRRRAVGNPEVMAGPRLLARPQPQPPRRALVLDDARGQALADKVAEFAVGGEPSR